LGLGLALGEPRGAAADPATKPAPRGAATAEVPPLAGGPRDAGGLPPAATAAPPVTVNWATAQAAELTREGKDHEARGEPGIAARRYLDALGFDPTYGPAYLALGALREAAGDPREAERAYATGIDHVSGFSAAHLARARLRARLQRLPDAIADLEAASTLRPEDLALLAELARAYIAAAALPAALAVSRRIANLAPASAPLGAEARVNLRALALLVGAADPVTAGATSRGPVRRALALAARRP
jgi:tetratricopeptide (TPR) repeat protein